MDNECCIVRGQQMLSSDMIVEEKKSTSEIVIN